MTDTEAPSLLPPKGRTCVICGKPGGFPMTLKLMSLGIDGTYAHLPCANRRQRQQDAYEQEIKNDR